MLRSGPLLVLLLIAGGCPGEPPPDAPDGDEVDLADVGDLAAALDLRYPFRHYAINHVLCTGQSLSIGVAGSPALSTTQPYANLMFASGVVAGGAGLTMFAPLIERNVETMSSALSNLVTRMAREEVFLGQDPASHELLISCHGIGGTAYAGLKKGTGAYATGMAQLAAGKKIADAMGRSYVVRAVTNVHGESDHLAKNGAYAENLLTWQADYEADVKAVTGQSDPVPMFHSQMSSWTKYNSTTSAIPAAQLAASLARPDRLILIGPKYALPYSDGVHLTNEGYRQLGEYHAKTYRQVVLEGRPFSPLRPLRATRDGAVITVTFHVPVPPLVLDTQRVIDPGRYGFEFASDQSPPTITQVELAGADAVRITLSRAPEPGGRLRYAYTGTVAAAAGPRTGPRGNLRDSDSTTSRHGYGLFNWCIHFDLPVP